MKIIQMLPTLAYGDAIGNDVLALDEALKSAGYDTEIYAENIDKRLPKRCAKYTSKYRDSRENIIIFHLSIGSSLAEQVLQYEAKVIIVYHNVTPPVFWKSFSHEAEKLCEDGIACVKRMSGRPMLCLADSKFNKEDLIRLGYTCPIEVLPILIAFDDYAKKPDEELIRKYKNDGYTNILFTGRIAPNKKQEDLIAAFYYYKNYINPKSRLILAGSFQKKDVYYNKLRNYADQLGLDDVIFTGHIPFEQILAYYRIADVLLCLSEHEGFCVPLVEAMYFGVPIIAYDSTAVGETLGGSGLLLSEKGPKVVAEAVHKVATDETLRNIIISNEKMRLRDFENERIKGQFIRILKKCVEEI